MKPNCNNCKYFWGCRMSDNSSLDEGGNKPGCDKYSPKKTKQ